MSASNDKTTAAQPHKAICPKCANGQLKTINADETSCPLCNGVLLTHGALSAQLSQLPALQLRPTKRASLNWAKDRPVLRCPECASAMGLGQIAERDDAVDQPVPAVVDIVVDTCEGCGAAFIDRGERERLLALLG